MAKTGQRAREGVEGVLRLRGAIDDAVVFLASVVLADVMVLEERYDKAKDLLFSLLVASNLRTTFTQSTQAKRLLERVKKQIAKDGCEKGVW